jgi:hypothetical protein
MNMLILIPLAQTAFIFVTLCQYEKRQITSGDASILAIILLFVWGNFAAGYFSK